MKRSEILLMILQVPVDLLMLFLAGLSAYYLRFSSWAVAIRPVIFHLEAPDFMRIVLWVSLAWVSIFALVGLYSTDPNRKITRDLSRILLACSAGLSAVAVYILFSQELFDSRFLVAAGWAFAILYVTIGRLLVRGLKALMYRAGMGLRRVVIVGNEEIANTIQRTLSERPELGYAVVGFFSHIGEEHISKIKRLFIDELIFTNPRAREEEALVALDFCNQHHIVFKYSADLFATYSANMVVQPLAGIPIVELKRTPLDGWGRVVKRLCDIVASVLALVILSPVMLIAALFIWCETGRPIIYKNERVGIRGNRFFTYKFRSMRQKDCTGSQFGKESKAAEARERNLIKKQSIKDGPIYKIANDPRVTPFGRFIRRYSIDELPQFWNVLEGTMSVVGPRPHQPREVRGYDKHERRVLTIKPGITGLAQISGRSDLSFEDEIRLDVLYIEKWSLWFDVIIVVKTPFVLFKKRKAL